MKIIVLMSFFSLFSVFFSAPLWAHNKVGNGGDVVVCEGVAARPLDHWEGEREGRALDFPEGTDPVQVAKDLARRLMDVRPQLVEHYQRRLGQIMEQIEFLSHQRLTNVRDSAHFVLPQGCGLQQAALRRTNPLPGEKEFLFDKQVWDVLGVNGKAGLLLHEVIHEHLGHMGEQDSIKARALNALVSSKDIFRMDKAGFKRWAQKARLPL